MRVVAAIFMMVICAASWAHGGGTDAQGCHTNRKTGDYHCHSSKGASAALAPLPTSRPAPAGAPTCYVGPRGGTYTITKSGRKNYAGC